MKKITLGITAHVDSGKTTLAEALLYNAGVIRRLGRVDNGDSALDTSSIERERGITIFSSQAEFNVDDVCFTLLDTPGHIDFTAETERTMCVLDYAILVINGNDGIQSHTLTLWRLLQKYEIPVFIFVNKMDITFADKSVIMDKLRSKLSSNCVDFSVSRSEATESAASCSESLMEKYLSDEAIDDKDIADSVSKREIFPCCFGSALKLDGINEFIAILKNLTLEPEHSTGFGAKVYKISYDEKGTRLTHLKIMGGKLNVREELEYTDSDRKNTSGKVSSIRFYTGEKFQNRETAFAGDVCAITGLTGTFAGQGIGYIRNSERTFIEPVMTYKVIVPAEKNSYEVLKDMRMLEDEDPQLHVVWNEQNREIHIQLMGNVQLEILTRETADRFGYDIEFCNGAVAYKETIRRSVEGVGHYEPLKHYAEAHILLEPLPRNSGLIFETSCSEDVLDRNWQRLIMTHLTEKAHKGVLTGSPISDMKLTLVAGKAHQKHTEGGDFRQATYRAIRQGLRSTESLLLEPFYDYEIEVPTEHIGRVMTDMRNMSAEFSVPETFGEMSVIKGCAPVSEMSSYHSELIAYTRGKGHISLSFCGYKECHNAEKVISDIGYNFDSDTENSADSIFCSHGAGYNVKWDEVYDYMHLPLATAERDNEESTEEIKRKASNFVEKAVSDEELMAIFEMTYGKIPRDQNRAFKKTRAVNIEDKNIRLPKYEGPDYLLVDGYNIIFSWDDLKKIAEDNLDAARGELIHRMCNYQGYAGCELILVFDAYKVKGKHRDVEKYCNINIVYTKESETADSYIERVTHSLSKNHRVRVATSDGVEQMIILGNGAMRISANEFRKRCEAAESAIKEYIDSMK